MVRVSALEYVPFSERRFRKDTAGPGFWYRNLAKSEEFRVIVGDRLHELTKKGGVLSSQKAAARYRSLLDEVTPLLLPEALRWGDGNMGAKHSRLLEMNGRRLWGRRVGCLPSFSLSVPLSLKKSFVSRGSILY